MTTLLGFLERIGAPLVSPRAAMQRAAGAPAGRGAVDGVLLLALLWLAEHLAAVAHALFRALDLGLAAGLQSLFMTLQAVVPTVLGVGVAALAMSLIAGPSRQKTGAPRADAIDLAAYAAVPLFAVTAFGELVFAVRGRAPSVGAGRLTLALGLAWAAVAWLFGALSLRARRSAGDPT
jgi:hypothetical protein